MQIIDQTNNTVLADKAVLANNPWTRMKGLLGRHLFIEGEALVITGCNSIHMFFMKFPIDVVFIDRQGCVVGLLEGIKPFGLSPVFWKATTAIELPAGIVSKTHVKLNDNIAIL